MIKKLLNRKNLIIILLITVLCLFFMPHNVYAETETLSDLIGDTVSAWFQVLKAICIIIMLITFIIIIINGFLQNTGQSKYTVRKMITQWIIGFFLLVFIDTIIYAVIMANESVLEICKTIGTNIAGQGETDETSLYESAISKAYEIKMSSGFLGMILYIGLVYYLVRFLYVYVKRFINVMILIIVSPIVVTQHSIKKIVWGTAGKLKLWFKELVYNVFIQSFHALAYSLMIGLALSVSDSLLSFVGAILVLIMFSFMLKLEKWIRMLFNVVGGVEMSKGIDTDKFIDIAKHPVQSINSAKESIQNFDARQAMTNIKNGVGSKFEDAKESINQAKNAAIDFKDNYKEYTKEAFDTMANGKYVHVTRKEIDEAAEMHEKSITPKVTMAIANTNKKIAKNAKHVADQLSRSIGKRTDYIKDCLKQTKNDLNQDMKALNSMKKGLSSYKRRMMVMDKVMNDTASEEEVDLASILNTGDSIDAEVNELKQAMSECDGDIVAAMYQVYGPQAFMFNKEMGGDSQLGLSTLASAMHMDKVVNAISGKASSVKRKIKFPSKKKKIRNADKAENKKQKVENNESKENKNKNKNISTVDADLQLTEGEETSKKKYTIVGCNDKTMKTVTSHLHQRFILNNKLLSPLYKMNLKIKSGFINLRGQAVKTEVTENTTTSEENVTIKYQGNFSRHQLMQMLFSRNKSIGKLKERKSDNNWARVANIKQAQNRIYKQVMINDVMKAANYGATMGRGDLSRSRQAENRVRPKNREKTEDGIQAENMLKDRISKMFNNEARINEQKSADSAEKADKMLSVLVVATAMQNNNPLETFDLKTNEENQKSILETLSKYGIVSNEEISDTNKKGEVLKGIEEKINTLVTDETGTYYQIVANYANQRLEDIIEQISATEDEEPDKFVTVINDVGEIVRQKVNEADEIIGNKATQAKETAQELFEDARMNSQTINKIGVRLDNIKDRTERIKAIMEDPYVQAVAIASTQVAGEILMEEMKKALDENLSPILNEASQIIERDIERARIENPGELLKEKIEIAKENVKESIKETEEEIVENIKESAKSLIIPWPEEEKSEKSEKGKKGGKNRNDDSGEEEGFIVYVWGEVINEGKQILKNLSTARVQAGDSYTVYDAIMAAGGVTANADREVVCSIAGNKIKNRTAIIVPRVQDGIDEVFYRCFSQIKKTIKDYRIENNLEDSPISELKETEHKNKLTSRLHRILRNEKVDGKELSSIHLESFLLKAIDILEKEFNIASEYQQQNEERAAEEEKLKKQQEEAARFEAALRETLENINAERLEAVPSQSEAKQKAREMEMESYENNNSEN